MYTIIYFSPTGNILHLAKIMADGLDVPKEDVLPLEFTDPSLLGRNNQLVLLFPVHGFNAPRTVKRFVRSMPSGLYQNISLITVGSVGNWMNWAVSSELRNVLEKKEYSIAMDEDLAMPLTFIMNFPHDLNVKLINRSERRIGELCQRITEGESSSRKVPIKSKLMNFLGKIESPAARLFGLELHASNDCTSCGTCWKNCPEKNIRENSKGKPSFGFSCSMCMRCIYQCPEKAISPRVSKFIPIKGGYKLSNYIKE